MRWGTILVWGHKECLLSSVEVQEFLPAAYLQADPLGHHFKWRYVSQEKEFVEPPRLGSQQRTMGIRQKGRLSLEGLRKRKFQKFVPLQIFIWVFVCMHLGPRVVGTYKHCDRLTLDRHLNFLPPSPVPTTKSSQHFRYVHVMQF